ncbi:MAG: phosphopantetheine-binding protein [Nitrospirota bacterium]|mgnify:CR=1 FL=1
MSIRSITLLMLCLAAAVTAAMPDNVRAGQRAAAPKATTGSNVVRSIDAKLLEQVRKIAADILRVKPRDIAVDVPLSKQKFRADDLDMVEIVMALEEAYKIEIPDNELGRDNKEIVSTMSVRKLAEIVARKQSK